MTSESNPSGRWQIDSRPADLLAGVAAATWQAYNAMQTTKQRHIQLLQRLDDKKKNYNIEPTDSERHLLADLLADHDAQVKAFTVASQALKLNDSMAHQALFVYIGQVDSATLQERLVH